MAPDSSLHRHRAAGSEAGLRIFVKVAASLLLSLLIFHFPAQAGAGSTEIPGALAALSLPGDLPKRDNSAMPLTLPTLTDALKGTSPVLWRNGIQIPPHEPLIERYIRFYQGDGRTTFSDAMEKARTCLPQMTEILESQGVPAEMVSIVFVESRFEKNSLSYRGAGGYWQMMAATARDMGLRVDPWVDERRDPIKSTKAAAKYLKTLYEKYDSWLLALAAYNAGTRPINCVARKCCVKDGELYGRRMPAYSAVYVSKVLAAMNIIREPEKYGFEYPNYCRPTDFDPVFINTPLKLEEVAQWIEVPVSRLQELNPSLRLDAMCPGSGFALRLPSGSREKFDLAYEVYTRR
ncbi:Lytic transglycosylase, catalytic [Syntrophobacter sp. SbD2]|nr:Lytic transglycosylase, catalytic [Syntrophobacter sp. SbD2]